MNAQEALRELDFRWSGRDRGINQVYDLIVKQAERIAELETEIRRRDEDDADRGMDNNLCS